MDYFELRGISPEVYATAKIPPWLSEQLDRLPKTAEILDFGCGFGQNMRSMKAHGFGNVSGADVSPQAIVHCRTEGFSVFDVSSGFSDLKTDGARFDVIVTTHVLEHIPKDQVIDILVDLRSLLRPGGWLLVAVPNAQAYTGAYWAYEDFTHHTLYTAGSLLYVLRAAGFTDIELLDRHAVVGSRFPRRVVRLALARLYRLNYAFWKKVMGSPTHIASPDVFTYEVKMKAVSSTTEI